MPSVYVTQPGAMVETEAGRLIVTSAGELTFSAPLARVTQVVLVGPVGVTTPALHRLLERGIGLVLLSTSGRLRGRLTPASVANAAARRRQYRATEDEERCLRLARAIVRGKVRNCRTLCLRWDATNDDPLLAGVCRALEGTLARLDQAPTRAALMGLEGDAARHYFEAVRHILGPDWAFARRARRPPPDPVNALFSLVYTLLYESCHAAVELAGLDPYAGIFHADEAGRASLALDLMEEFRPVVADSVALTVLRKRMLVASDFRQTPSGPRLSQAGWRVVGEQYARRLRTLVRPAGQERRISYQKVLEAQAHALRRALLGETDAYEPFAVK